MGVVLSRWREQLWRFVVRGAVVVSVGLLFAYCFGARARSALLHEVTLQPGPAGHRGSQVIGTAETPGWTSLDGPPGNLVDLQPVLDRGSLTLYGYTNHRVFRFQLEQGERTDIGEPFASSDIRGLQVHVHADGSYDVFVLTDSALYVSADRGEHWRQLLAPGELTPPREPVLQSFSVATRGRGDAVVAVSREAIFWLDGDRVQVYPRIARASKRPIGVLLLAQGSDTMCLIADREGMSWARDCQGVWQRIPEFEGRTIAGAWKRTFGSHQERLYVVEESTWIPLRADRLWRSTDGMHWDRGDTPALLRCFTFQDGDDCAGSSMERWFRVNCDRTADPETLLFSNDQGGRWQRLKLEDAPGGSMAFRCPAGRGGGDVLGLRGGRLLRLDIEHRLWEDYDVSAPVQGISSVAIDRSDATLWATTPIGLFGRPRGGPWRRVQALEGAAYAVAAAGRAGTSGAVVGTTNGLYRRTADEGWKRDDDLGDHRVTAIATLEADVAWVGTDDGVFRHGDGWRRVDATARGENVNAIAAIARDVVIVGGERGVYSSTDGGATFRRSAVVTANTLAVGAVQIKGSRTLVAGTAEGAYVSRDLGAAWQRVFPGDGEIESVTSIVTVDGPGGPRVYLGTVGRGLVWSADLRTWQGSPAPTVRHVSALAPGDRGGMVVGTFDRSVWEFRPPPEQVAP